MITIDKNLLHLTEQYSICDRTLVEDFSINIQLGSNYYEPLPEKNNTHVIYGSNFEPHTLFSGTKEIKQNVSLKPGDRIIACSKHKYKIPLDYFGLVQTKGTLARLFVQATCNDGQIEPGFDGFITLEIINMSPWIIELPFGSDVAQLYLLKCSTKASTGYHGRYQNACKNGPTLAIFKK